MDSEQARLLDAFASEHDMLKKGGLSLALVVTDHARRHGLPLDPSHLLTPQGGQVKGLGRSAVKTILARHGISRTLAAEGGRTSRGNMARMRKYVALLNALHADPEEVEDWWVQQVRLFFSRQPLRLRLDQAQSVSATISDVLDQAMRRQAESHGATYVGTVLQQLVAAKLDLVTDGNVDHHGAAVADESVGASGDYLLADVAVHVTTAPSEALMAKCQQNLQAGLKPVIITLRTKIQMAAGLADQGGIGRRVDIFDAEQFVAGNVYELGQFQPSGRDTTARELIARYNRLIDEYENDPSLRIEVPR